MNPRQTVAVAPVNWNTIQMLGTTAEPKKMQQMRKAVMREKRTVSCARAVALGKRMASRLRRREKLSSGKTNMMCTA